MNLGMSKVEVFAGSINIAVTKKVLNVNEKALAINKKPPYDKIEQVSLTAQ